FFFSSRRRHTRFSRDWSSDVCSSDLKRKGLGKGLDALLSAGLGISTPSLAPAAGAGETTDQLPPDGKLAQIPVEFCQRGKYQPRRDMHPEQLEELAESISRRGRYLPR